MILEVRESSVRSTGTGLVREGVLNLSWETCFRLDLFSAVLSYYFIQLC